MSKWLVSGDWQAEFRNLGQCSRTHRQELEIIKQYGVTGVIDLGDLKEHYNNGDYRALEFQIRRIKNIRRAGCYFLAVMGNHDRYGQYNDAANWFSMLRTASPFIFDEPGTHIVGKAAEFFILPYRSDRESLLKDAVALRKLQSTSPAKNKILLFHCNVRGATFANGMLSESTISLKDLHAGTYDFCFGGDIHRRQQLRNNAWYIGSPFCHDWGEANLWHGFLLFDDETGKMTWLQSEVPGWFTWDWLRKHTPQAKKLVAVKGVRIRRTQRVSGKNYFEQIASAERLLKKMFPLAIVSVKPEFNDVVVTDLNIRGHQSDKERVEAYFDSTAPKELRHHKPRITKYMLEVLGRAGATVRTVDHVTIESFHAENVLSFKSLDFDYRKRGVCLVHGVNRAWPKRSIGAGKSNFLGMIPVAWFGKTFKKKQTADRLAYEHNSKKAVVRLVADVDGEKVTIERGRRPVKLKMLINGEDKSSGRRHTGRQDTQGLLENRIGFTFDTLASAVYIDSTFANKFLSGGDADRAHLISKFQNLERFSLAAKIVESELSEAERKWQKCCESISTDKQLLTQAKGTLAIFARKAKANLSALKKQMIADGEKQTSVERKLSKWLAANREEIHRQEVRKEELQEKQKGLESRSYKFKRQLEDSKKELSRLQSPENQVCPTCERPLPKEQLESLRENYERQYTEAQIWLKKHSKDLLKVRNDILTNEAWHGRLTSALSELRVSAETMRQLARTSRRVYMKAREEREDADVAKQKKRIKELRMSLAVAKKRIDTLAFEKLELQYVEASFKRRGMPLFINNLTAPVLNAAAQEYSQMFTEGEIQVRFELTDGLFTPRVINAHGSKNLEGQSTGELGWASIIVSFALQSIGPKTNVLILDEPGNGLDPESATVFARKLKLLTDRFETILVTSHNTQIVGELDGENTICVVKEGRSSRLQ